ncbi:MAG: hypothetical protein QOJ99_1987 [Bryobacterales bacterium]|nr:hypothetical protein [Bryobacterales bacterium]
MRTTGIKLLVPVAAISVIAACVGLRTAKKPSTAASPEARDLERADRFAKLGNWDKAGPIYVRLETRYRELGDKRNELYAHVSRFGSEAESLNLEEISHELQAILLRQDVQQDLALKQRCLEMKGYVDLNFDGVSARPTFEELERVTKTRGDTDARSRASGDLGILAFLEGNSSEAKWRVAKAIASSFLHGDKAAQVRYLSLMGQGQVETHRAGDSLWFFDRALSISRRTPDAGFPKLAVSGKASALTQLGRFAESRRVISEGLQYARLRSNIGFEVDMLAQDGELAEKENRTSDAIQLYETAANHAAQIHFNRGAAEVNARLAALYKSTGKLAQAERCEENSIRAHMQMSEVYELPHHLAVRADLQEARGKLREAERTYLIAERVVGTMLRNSPTPGLKKSVVAAMSEVYLGHFRLAVRQNDFLKAYNVIEEVRGRVASDRLRTAERDRRTRPAIAAAERRVAALQMQLMDTSDPGERKRISDSLTDFESQTVLEEESPMNLLLRQQPSLEDLRTSLAPNEVVLEYVIGDEKSFCLLITSNHQRIIPLPDRKTIDALTNSDLVAIRSGKSGIEEGKRLYSAIVAPLGDLPENADLIVIPDGNLHRVPFATLVDSSNRYLMETHTISYSPSSSVLTLIRHNQTLSSSAVLAVGNVEYTGEVTHPEKWRIFRGLETLRRSALSPLPATGDEVLNVTSTLRNLNGTVLSGKRATESNFKREIAKGEDVVHLAVHAVTDEAKPDRAGLVFAEGDATDDGLLQVREIRHLPLSRTSLVTLSACDTSTGPIEGEEGVSSIVYAFLYAGAKASVTSYWMVEDSSTGELMKIFYTELSHGRSAAAALGSAQRELFARGEETKAPFYWAAFSVIGDGSRTIEKAPTHDN